MVGKGVNERHKVQKRICPRRDNQDHDRASGGSSQRIVICRDN